MRWGNTVRHLGLLALAAAHSTSNVEHAGASASLRPLTFRLLPTYDHAIASAASLVFGMGGGVDCYAIEPYAGDPGTQVTTRSTAIDPVLSSLAGIRIMLSELAHITAAGGLDIDLAPSHFVAQQDDALPPLLELPRVRPAVLAALSVTLSRRSRFGPSEEAL